MVTLANFVANLRQRVRNFWNENNIGRASYSTVESYEAGVPAHGFENHHTIMALCRGVKFIERINRGSHRRIEAKRRKRASNIVIDRLWHPDYIYSLSIQPMCDVESAITSNRNQRVDTDLP